MPSRSEKLPEHMKEVLAKILHEHLDFDQDVFISIVGVVISPTLEHATVRISVFPDNYEKKALQTIENNIYDIQQMLNTQLKTRKIPKLSFKLDRTEANAARIENLLENVVE